MAVKEVYFRERIGNIKWYTKQANSTVSLEKMGTSTASAYFTLTNVTVLITLV